MRDTQVAAWESLQSSLSDRRSTVLQEIRKHPKGVPLFQIAKNLGWTINRVSGRVTELCTLGLIRDSELRVVNPSSGKQCIAWQYAPSIDRQYKKQRDKNTEIRELRKKVYELTKEVRQLKSQLGIREERHTVPDVDQLNMFDFINDNSSCNNYGAETGEQNG